MREIRYAIRSLARNRGLSIAVILVLALGIGANSAIFTVVRAVLMAPLPYRDPDRLVRMYERAVIGSGPFNSVSGLNFYDWQKQATSFESMGYYGEHEASFAPTDGGLPENLTGVICDSGFFPTLGVPAVAGRTFRPEDDRIDSPRVVVIANGLWRRRFGGEASAIGSTIRLDGELHTIIGVMPKAFDFPSGLTQIWLPVNRILQPDFRTQRGNHRFSVIGRVRAGVTIEQSRAELDGIAAAIKARNPGDLTGKGANVVLLAERMVVGVRPMLYVLLGAVGCVLLIACVNVGNLLLARAVAARREVAVRLALGAGRMRIVRQFVTESLLLSFAGSCLGIVFAGFGTDVLIKMAGYIPRIESVRVDGVVLAFTAAIAILTGIAVGLVPAMTSAIDNLPAAMQAGSRSSTAGRGRGLFRDAMIAVELALSLMLLAGAGLMLKSFTHLRAVDPGFVPDRVLTIQFSLPSQRYKTPSQVAQFYSDVLARVRNTPGVEAAGLVTVPPLAGHFSDETFTIDGRPPLAKGQFLDAVIRTADPGFFKAAGIRLLRGRIFTDAERLEAANKGVITESMAATIFPNEDPIGKWIRLGEKEAFEIVGIVADTRQDLASLPEPMMYFPVFHGDTPFSTLFVRASNDPNQISLPIQKEMRQLDPDLPAVIVRTMDEITSGSTQQSRFGLTLIAIFATLAVILAAVGLYGVLAYSVGQRTSEIGLRIALGAGNSSIAKLVLWQGFMPALIGMAFGIAGSLAGARLIQTMLYDASAADPIVLGSVVLLLAAITLAACVIPAMRATRIDPMIAMRVE